MARRDTRTCLLLVYMLMTLATFVNFRPTEASVLEKWLIMPGPVVSSHANTESACDSCHDPLSDRPQFELCVTCHAAVGDDLKRNVGLHGRLPEAQRFECAACHTDHEGRDKVIVELDEAAFDHALTDYILSGAHKGVACNDCHSDSEKHREAPSTCSGCHRNDDPHNKQFGQACAACHSSSNWSETDFDHDAAAFLFTGIQVDRSCVTCHRKDDTHAGRNGSLCADCHNTQSWATAIFNHLAVSGFGLDGGHQGLSCQDCHSSSDHADLGGSNCNACHRSDDVHDGRNGSDCVSCHVADSWRLLEFDHASQANMPLPPGHESLACNACHKGDVHAALPRSCAGCHRSEDAHKGQLGTQCESCHIATDWVSRVWFDHDLVSFPLLGAHAEATCDQCHKSAAFHDAGTDCVSCHANDDPHRGAFGKQCDDCHNPSIWHSWQFDHDTQTSFALSGAHAAIACAGCHKAPLGDRSATSSDCISCHRREDRHSGRFGNNCGSCHNTSTFSQVEGL